MILVTGAGGFVGTHLLKRLAAHGLPVRALDRRSVAVGRTRRTAGSVWRLSTAEAASLKNAVQGVEQVIHLGGIFRECGQETFEAAHHEGTRLVMEAAREARVRHVVYVSALGAAPDRLYPFIRSKWLGEEEVRKSGVPFTILRPSLLFGEGDHFLTPLTRLLGSGSYTVIPRGEPLRCQPLWVGDLVSCLVKTVQRGAGKGDTIAVAGPEPVTFEGVVDLLRGSVGNGGRKVRLSLFLIATLTLVLERAMETPPLTTGVLDIWRLGATASPDTIQKAYGFAPMPLTEGMGYLVSSHQPLGARGNRERTMTPNRSI